MAVSKKALSVTIDLDTFRDLEFVTAYRGVNRSALIQMALSDYVRKERARIERANEILNLYAIGLKDVE